MSRYLVANRTWGGDGMIVGEKPTLHAGTWAEERP
jgi:hypothetical protein